MEVAVRCERASWGTGAGKGGLGEMPRDEAGGHRLGPVKP